MGIRRRFAKLPSASVGSSGTDFGGNAASRGKYGQFPIPRFPFLLLFLFRGYLVGIVRSGMVRIKGIFRLHSCVLFKFGGVFGLPAQGNFLTEQQYFGLRANRPQQKHSFDREPWQFLPMARKGEPKESQQQRSTTSLTVANDTYHR